MDKLKIYKVEFDPLYPVGGGLILLTKSKKEALTIALDTIKHKQTERITLKNISEVNSKKSGVIFYASGEY